MTNIKEIEWQKDGINIKTGYNNGLVKCKVGNLEFDLEKTGWDWITMNFIKELYTKCK